MPKGNHRQELKSEPETAVHGEKCAAGWCCGAERGCCPLPASEMLCAFNVSLGCLWTSCSLFLQNSEFYQ